MNAWTLISVLILAYAAIDSLLYAFFRWLEARFPGFVYGVGALLCCGWLAVPFLLSKWQWGAGAFLAVVCVLGLGSWMHASILGRKTISLNAICFFAFYVTFATPIIPLMLIPISSKELSSVHELMASRARFPVIIGFASFPLGAPFIWLVISRLSRGLEISRR